MPGIEIMYENVATMAKKNDVNLSGKRFQKWTSIIKIKRLDTTDVNRKRQGKMTSIFQILKRCCQLLNDLKNDVERS